MQNGTAILVRKPSDFGHYADCVKKNKGISNFSGEKTGGSLEKIRRVR